VRFRLIPDLDLSAVVAEVTDTAAGVARLIIERPTAAGALGLSLAVVAVVLVVCAVADKLGAPDPLTDPNPWKD
jgi:hypothetical protein